MAEEEHFIEKKKKALAMREKKYIFAAQLK